MLEKIDILDWSIEDLEKEYDWQRSVIDHCDLSKEEILDRLEFCEIILEVINEKLYI